MKIKHIVMTAMIAISAAPALSQASTAAGCLVISQSFEGFSRMRQDGYPFSDAEHMIRSAASRPDVVKIMMAVARDAYQNPIYSTEHERNAAVNMHATTWLVYCLNESTDRPAYMN